MYLDAYMDASNTSTFAFYAAPADMTFASLSGAFLTPVPEPSVWVMALLGLPLLGCRKSLRVKRLIAA